MRPLWFFAGLFEFGCSLFGLGLAYNLISQLINGDSFSGMLRSENVSPLHRTIGAYVFVFAVVLAVLHCAASVWVCVQAVRRRNSGKLIVRIALSVFCLFLIYFGYLSWLRNCDSDSVSIALSPEWRAFNSYAYVFFLPVVPVAVLQLFQTAFGRLLKTKTSQVIADIEVSKFGSEWAILLCLPMIMVGLSNFSYLTSETTRSQSRLQLVFTPTVATGPPQLIEGLTKIERELNSHWSEGVTADNNLALALLAIFGESTLKNRRLDEVKRMLRIDNLRPEGRFYAAGLGLGAAEEQTLVNQLSSQEWGYSEHSDVGQIVFANEHALDYLSTDVPRYDNYYFPGLRRSDSRDEMGLASVRLNFEDAQHWLMQRLCCRAFLQMKTNRALALNDCFAALRMAILSQRSGMLITTSTAVRPVLNANQGLRTIAGMQKTTDWELRHSLARLNSLPKITEMTELVRFADRFLVLDYVCNSDVMAPVESALSIADKSLDEAAVRQAVDSEYELVCEALVIQKREGREAAYATFIDRLRKWNDRIDQFEFPTAVIEGDLERWVGRSAVSKVMAKMSTADNAVRYMKTQIQFTQYKMALELFRREHACFPDGLAELVPEFLPVVPNDPYTDRPVQYTYHPNGYDLRSDGAAIQDFGLSNVRGPANEQLREALESTVRN